LFLLATALVALPLLYAGLELPKLIINNAISSGHFPLDFLTLSISQTTYLFLLSTLYLAVILINGSLKYAINLHKGRVAESLLQRLRLTIYRHWRRDSSHDDRSAVIPMLVQEVEPIGGFAGDAFVLPLFQGGTFLTILLFMFLQDPVLGAAAITLLPVQLALIPRLQRRINDLARQRTCEMRGLGSAIGREIASQSDEAAGESRRQIAGTVRRLAAIRFEIYRKKFFVKGLNNFITQLTPFFFYTVGGYLVIEDRLSFGALVAVLAAHKDFSAPLKELLRYYQTMEDVRVRFDETQQFLLERTARRFSQWRSPSPGKPLAPAPLRSRPQDAMAHDLPAAAQRLTALQRKRALQPCRAQHHPH
jgi:ABC-type bacteriocin/lantibiotic exporter with double-glycine peptidase domain